MVKITINWKQLKEEATFKNLMSAARFGFHLFFVMWTLKAMNGTSAFWNETTTLTWLAGFMFSSCLMELGR